MVRGTSVPTGSTGAGTPPRDPAIAATLLEDAAAAVSRALRTQAVYHNQGVRDLPCYLFRAFMRRINRVKRQQLTAESALVAHFTEAAPSINPTVEMEVKILIDELLARCDSKAAGYVLLPFSEQLADELNTYFEEEEGESGTARTTQDYNDWSANPACVARFLWEGAEMKDRIDQNEMGVDDVVIRRNADMVRLERMTDNSFWMCVYRGGERVCFAIDSSAGDCRL